VDRRRPIPRDSSRHRRPSSRVSLSRVQIGASPRLVCEEDGLCGRPRVGSTEFLLQSLLPSSAPRPRFDRPALASAKPSISQRHRSLSSFYYTLAACIAPELAFLDTNVVFNFFKEVWIWRWIYPCVNKIINISISRVGSDGVTVMV
jgi:hypothetical protein